MADPVLKKITALTQIEAVAAADVMPIVDISEPNASLKNKKVRADQVTVFLASQLSSDVVENAKIKDAAVTAAKLATDAVETAKIKDLNVTTGKLADNAVSNTKLRDSGAMSVIGRSANSTGDPADITAGTDGYVLRRSGTTLGFGQVATAGIADNAITEAKLGTIKRTVMFRITAPLDEVEVLNFGNFFPWSVSLNGFVVVDARINLKTPGTSTTTVILTNQGGTMATLSLASGETGMSATGTIASSYRTASTNSFLAVNVSDAGTNAAGLTVTLVLEGNPA